MRNASAMLGLLAISAISAVGAAPAQAGYDYPVCLRVYGPATYNECTYTSMAQCKATASGRAAECYPNVFAAYPGPAPGGRAYRQRGAY
ncbi:DUF3551 domain-containing protein [Bradyrhizobium sp.]|jgi:hypothetical protein|uniref:DUF3551 domain-containing protein n=1 Tax=Bradyrhizobium sp. TaxID=376 RepID=UPI002DFC0C81|nr:DUF3551 domain-containing protein [Bradyrhizobium sp.]